MGTSATSNTYCHWHQWILLVSLCMHTTLRVLGIGPTLSATPVRTRVTILSESRCEAYSHRCHIRSAPQSDEGGHRRPSKCSRKSCALHGLLMQVTQSLEIATGVTQPAQQVLIPVCRSITLRHLSGRSLALLSASSQVWEWLCFPHW